MTYADAVIACADLAGRAGATGWQLAWTCPHVPDEDDNHTCPEVTWTGHVQYLGARIITRAYPDPTSAAMALAVRLLSDATCRCRQPVALADDAQGCRWRLVGQRWEPGCDAPSIRVHGARGDHTAMHRALDAAPEPGNRRERRAARRRR